MAYKEKNKDHSIHIHSIENGFTVTEPNSCGADYAFQSMKELLKHIESHFSFRASDKIEND